MACSNDIYIYIIYKKIYYRIDGFLGVVHGKHVFLGHCKVLPPGFCFVCAEEPTHWFNFLSNLRGLSIWISFTKTKIASVEPMSPTTDSC